MSCLTAGQPATRSRRLRRGLIALGIVAALPGAFTTASASAYHIPPAVNKPCAYEGSLFDHGTKITYQGNLGTCVDGQWAWGSSRPT